MCNLVESFGNMDCCYSVTKSCQLIATPWTAAHQAPLSSTISQSLLTFMSIESAMLSNHLILCHPLLLLPLILLSIRVFSNEPALHIRAQNIRSISPSNKYSRWFTLGLADLISLQSKRLSRVFSSTTVWKHQFFGAQPSLQSNSHICTWFLEKP